MGTSLLDCGPEVGAMLSRLTTPERNRYYYSKLLDSYHLELEQRYGNSKRWLINRLSLGQGVLCGLEVTASADGRGVAVSPGVAIDGYGREIIVPETSRAIDVRQPTDDCGRPDGLPLRGAGTVTLYICYHECEAEPAAVMVSECGPERRCENGLIRERYRLRIGRDEPAPPGLITPEQCARIFAQPPANTSRRTVLCQTLDDLCTTPDEACVPLAIIRVDEQGRIVQPIDKCTFRRTVYSNAVLLDLILCLAARVDQCCGALAVKSIFIVSGDNQAGTVGQPLAQPLVTRVVNGGNPVVNETVTYDVTPGSGRIGSAPNALGPQFVTKTDAAGLATLPIWELGPAPGAQKVTARIAAGTPAMVTFVAKAEPRVVDLPVIRVIWPTNAVRLDKASADPAVRQWFSRWVESPRIEITFNHKMEVSQLQKPSPWLRVFLVQNFGRNEIVVTPVAVAPGVDAPQPVLPDAGFAELFPLRLRPDDLRRGARLLVQIRSENDQIVDTDTPAVELDAEFQGTQLTGALLDEIWKLDARKTFPQIVWDSFQPSVASLPQSGNGVEGGLFHSWFEVAPLG